MRCRDGIPREGVGDARPLAADSGAMKAVFLHKHAVLRDSHIALGSPPEGWRLMPATLEATRHLADQETLLFLFGVCDDALREEMSAEDEGMRAFAAQIEAAGGRVDGVITCTHPPGASCRCWGDFPGLVWAPALQFALDPAGCYVLGDSEQDTTTAYGAGSRPLLILGDRTIGDVLGNQPQHKDFPIAPHLTDAVDYISTEEEIARQLGRPRHAPVSVPVGQVLQTGEDSLPKVALTSALARGLQARATRARTQLRDIVRWLWFLVVGAVGLSLGIAYLLTHLYRQQPFPKFVWYATLQFIPRPLRGAMFILLGAAVILIALRSYLQSTSLWRRRLSH